MKGTIRATVKVAGDQRERRFTPGTPARVIKAWKIDMRAKLSKRYSAALDRATAKDRATLKADAERYYPLVKHLADWVTRRSEVRAWFPHIGHLYRHQIRREDVLRVRGIWKEQGRAERTINNRVSALRDLYRKLDGDLEPTPCDGVKPLKPRRGVVQVVSPDVVNTVLANLEALAAPDGERGAPNKHALQDRARLMVLASTGKRPCEVERAQPSDIDLRRRVWAVRDAKGGWSEGMYLNDEMLIAWQTFIAVEAWGEFPDHFPRRLRSAGWPDGVRPYNLRHSTWITASERGADLSDIQAGAGQKHISTTRMHYVPVLNSRMQKLSTLIDGRFGWRLAAAAGTAEKSGATEPNS